jgi:plasmid stabilization system protein ParE
MTRQRRARLERALAPLSKGPATGRVVSYSIGHAVSEVEITWAGTVVRLRAEATRRIEAWNRWDVMDLRSWVDPDGNAVIVDRDAGFKLVAGAVFVLGPDGAPLAEEDDDELPG